MLCSYGRRHHWGKLSSGGTGPHCTVFTTSPVSLVQQNRIPGGHDVAVWALGGVTMHGLQHSILPSPALSESKLLVLYSIHPRDGGCSPGLLTSSL